MEQNFVKLSSLVNDDFVIEKVAGYSFKKWDNEAKKMLTSDTYQEGYRKVYGVDTNKGKLDLGTGQIGSLFEAVQHAGKADLIGVRFAVKSNGKTGMDIRYYFNPVKIEKADEGYDLSDIPGEY